LGYEGVRTNSVFFLRSANEFLLISIEAFIRSSLHHFLGRVLLAKQNLIPRRSDFDQSPCKDSPPKLLNACEVSKPTTELEIMEISLTSVPFSGPYI
ncbi:MAG: hypothetical protein WBI23_05310, partial [Methanothrix sp.]